MMKKINRVILAGTGICVLLAGCVNKPKPSDTVKNSLERYENISADVGFDTLYSYLEYTDSQTTAKENFARSTELLRYYNQLFDIYNSYEGINNLKTINDNAGIQPIKVDQPLIDMLLTAKDFYDYSNGEFDITMGALLKVWHQYREEGISLNAEGKEGNVPTDDELTQAAACRGWQNVQINDDENTVYITQPCQSFDVGGIAKGYATEILAEALQDDMHGGYFNVGRNIRTVHSKPDNTPWNIGIADPEGILPDGLAVISDKGSFSFVTSGDYERFYKANDGNTYHHIIDPNTNFPANFYRSVTIFTQDSGAADCLSTTLFTLSVDEGKQVLDAYKTATGKEANAVWVMDIDKKQGTEGKELDQYYVVNTAGLDHQIAY